MIVLLPLVVWSTRQRARRGVKWQGIDWSRGMSEAARQALEGMRLKENGQYAEAVAAFDRALALQPNMTDALLARAVARQRLGRLDDALADYDRAIAIGGPSGEALNNRGCLHRERGELDRAISDLNEAIEVAPDFAVAHVSLAEALAERRDWDAALAALKRGIERDATWREHARTSAALAALREARPESDVFTA